MWIHSYRPLRDHCERSKLGGARGGHLSPLPPEARSCASRAAPRGSRRGPKPGPAARSCRAQPLLAPPRGPLSAIGGLDSLRQSAGFSTARLRAVESSRVGQCPAGSSARGARPAASAARTLPAPSASSARTLHQHVSRMLNSNWHGSIGLYPLGAACPPASCEIVLHSRQDTGLAHYSSVVGTYESTHT